MPFGIQLPGPFTWHAQDKSSKELLRKQRKQSRQDWVENANELLRQNEDSWIMAVYGPEVFTEIHSLQRVSQGLAEQKRRELLQSMDKAAVLQPLARASRTKREYRRAYAAKFGGSPTLRDIFAFNAAWKTAKREREG